MLVKPKELIGRALAGEYAAGGFYAFNLEFTQAIVAAAEEAQAPVFIQITPAAIAYGGLRTLVGIIRGVAEDAQCPVVLHADHLQDFDLVRACIEAGCTSVMVSFPGGRAEEYLRQTKTITAYAHDRGVWVEAQLPEEMSSASARKFVETTQVDALAVTVGTVHGAFTGQEYIRFETLEAIEAALPNFPLVLHGASGVADKHIRQVAATNVVKVNFDTEIRVAFGQALSALPAPGGEVQARLELARAAAAVLMREKIRLLGSAGQGIL